LLLLMATTSAALAASGTVLRTDKLYSQPSATASVAGTAAKGTSVTVVAKQGGWLRVTAGKTTGWMRLLSVRNTVPNAANAELVVAISSSTAAGIKSGFIVSLLR